MSQSSTPGEGDCHQYVQKDLREQERSDRHDGRSFQRGIEDNMPGYGPVSNTDGRQTPAVVGKLYLPSVVEEDTVQALMDLSLPRFSTLGDGVLPKTEPWPVTEKSPASPVSARDGNERVRLHHVLIWMTSPQLVRSVTLPQMTIN